MKQLETSLQITRKSLLERMNTLGQDLSDAFWDFIGGRYACTVCGAGYSKLREAVNCSSKGVEGLPPKGTIFVIDNAYYFLDDYVEILQDSFQGNNHKVEGTGFYVCTYPGEPSFFHPEHAVPFTLNLLLEGEIRIPSQSEFNNFMIHLEKNRERYQERLEFATNVITGDETQEVGDISKLFVRSEVE